MFNFAPVALSIISFAINFAFSESSVDALNKNALIRSRPRIPLRFSLQVFVLYDLLIELSFPMKDKIYDVIIGNKQTKSKHFGI